MSGGAEDLAGLFLGMIGYALVLSVVDYGTAGPGMWFRAKFLNQTASSSTTSSSTTSAPATQPSVVLA